MYMLLSCVCVCVCVCTCGYAYVCVHMRTWVCVCVHMRVFVVSGEFGVVYQGLLLPKNKAMPEIVAIKTLNGMKYNNCSLCAYRISSNSTRGYY